MFVLFLSFCLLTHSLSIEEKRFLGVSDKDKNSAVLWMIFRELDKLDTGFVNLLKQNHKIVETMQNHSNDISKLAQFTETKKGVSGDKENIYIDSKLKNKIGKNMEGIEQNNKKVNMMKTSLDKLQREMKVMQTKLGRFKELEDRLDAAESKLTRLNTTDTTQQGEISHLKALKAKIDEMQNRSGKNTKKVGFTACAKAGTVSKGHALVFSSIRRLYGLKSLSSLQSSGTFTTEESGLYLIVISVTSPTNGGVSFYLIKNKTNHLFKLYIPWASGYKTGTISILLNLNAGDTLELEANNDILVLNLNCVSHMTLVKIH